MDDDILPSEIVAELVDFLSRNCSDRIEDILAAADESGHYGCEVNVEQLVLSSNFVGLKVLNTPDEVLPSLYQALDEVQSNVCEDLDGEQQKLSVKRNVHARLYNLPKESKQVKQNASMLRSADINTLISINVTIVRVGAVMIREVLREYECVRCKHKFTLEGDISAKGSFLLPTVCPSEGSQKKCQSTSFQQVEKDIGECRDYQEVKAQEKVGSIDVGSVPSSLLVVLTDDLVDCCKPGDDAVITGVLRQRWNRNPVPGARCDLELLVEALGVKLRNEQKASISLPSNFKKDLAAFWGRYRSNPLEGRNVIIKSICPELYGMFLVKLILAMTIIGGVTRDDKCGTRVRGESHLLVVGDPGTGKSQILKYAAALCPRSVLTTGIGTTSAGLTVTAVRDPASGEWALDAGALVLADGGLCCIDEFSSIRESDRVSIHEAMEQQTLSVAKAGLVCSLDTKATVIAATNPSAGRISANVTARLNYEQEDENAVYLNLAAPLLSRFDVVLTLIDPKDNQNWDERLSSFILNGRLLQSDVSNNDSAESAKLLTATQLQQYFYFIKSTLHPELSDGARKLLSYYYSAERAAERRNAARTTVRLLESLIRLTQAHARLMCRKTAVVQDGVFAIAAVEASAVNPSVLEHRSATLHGFVPEDAEKDYRFFADYILVKLGLKDELDPFEGYEEEFLFAEDGTVNESEISQDNCASAKSSDDASGSQDSSAADHDEVENSSPCGQERNVLSGLDSRDAVIELNISDRPAPQEPHVVVVADRESIDPRVDPGRQEVEGHARGQLRGADLLTSFQRKRPRKELAAPDRKPPSSPVKPVATNQVEQARETPKASTQGEQHTKTLDQTSKSNVRSSPLDPDPWRILAEQGEDLDETLWDS